MSGGRGSGAQPFDHAPITHMAAGLERLTDPVVDVDDLWEDVEVSGTVTSVDASAMIEGFEVLSSLLQGLTLTGIAFDRATWRNVRVESSELSGVMLDAARLSTVEFLDCRLTGVALPTARLQHVRFRRCRMDGAAMRMTHTERLVFDECDLRGADFYGADLRGVIMHNCNLDGVDFTQATMTGAKLHGSSVVDLIGSKALTGVEIDAEQLTSMAMNVLAALDIRVTSIDDA